MVKYSIRALIIQVLLCQMGAIVEILDKPDDIKREVRDLYKDWHSDRPTTLNNLQNEWKFE